jgi:ketosteroid isomerase-like protein
MSDTNLALIDEIYDAFNRRDYESVLAKFTPDFEWVAAENSPLADQSPYHGIDSICSGVFDRIAAGFERLEVMPDEVFTGDDGRVVMLGYYHGRFRGGSEDFRTQVAHIWTIRDRKAIKFQQYLDTLKVSSDAAAMSA